MMESSMLKRYRIQDGRVVETPDEVAPILLFIAPTDEEKRHLVEALKVDEHTLTSSLDPDEEARLEFEPNHMAMILKVPKNYSGADQFLFRISSSGVFLFMDKLIVVRREDVPLFEDKAFTRISSLKDVVLKLIYRGIYHFNEHLKIINMISDSLEGKINASMQNKYLIHLFTLEKSLVYYLNAINSNAWVIEKLKGSSAKAGFSQENIEYLEDLIIENHQSYRQAEIYSNILASLMDARVSIVSNNLNVLMKTLNIITIGIMVPTLVVSAFSMNVTIPFQKHPFAFWIIMGFAMLSVGAVLTVWRMKRW
jgi:magnesium transporter